MGRIGLVVVLVLGLLMTSLAVEAQQSGKIYCVGLSSLGDGRRHPPARTS
jgi:hypothetical protein